MPGGSEWIIIGIVALLLFGRRLPEVARSVGKSIVEFKRGIRDVQDDIDTESKRPDSSSSRSRGVEQLPDDRRSDRPRDEHEHSHAAATPTDRSDRD
ncbi:MAG: twin-arginine translocase TatA/TatE family subunit [Phycisphaerae bacterium]|nr:twin-arginine translocase TatA/TatE family subunit [Phycisphaerae bacterium]